MINPRFKSLIFAFLFFLFGIGTVSAFEITKYENMPVEGDLVLGPGKSELFLSPGEVGVKELKITNRTGNPLQISVDIEDFTGDNLNSTKLLGNDRGPYSLRDYIKPEKSNFILAHGEKANLIVDINIPKDAEPGGLYGAAIIRADKVIQNNPDGKVEGTKGQVSLSTRLASLFFVRIKGDAKEEGQLKSFLTDKKFYQNGNVNFSILYENTGRVHLNPYATIEITNLLGKKIDSLDVAPWFVMPGFSRDRTVQWNKTLALGRYTATLKLNKGYGDNITEAKTTFYIIPLKIVLIGLGSIIILAILIVWFSSKFELKKNK